MRDSMDRGMVELIRGPFVRFRTKHTVRCGYILSESDGSLVVWCDGKPLKILKSQVLFRQ